MRHLFVCIILFFAQNLFCQFYSNGSEPFSVKWEQINSENFNIIFPSGCKYQAETFATLLEDTRLSNNWGLNSKDKPLRILMHNQNVLSNAFVMWAPRRMEVINIPPQDNYAQNWLEQLVLHEYRHVLQVSKLNQGITKYLSYLTGDLAIGAEVGFLPLWYIEGDAVLTETALSSSGRGRDAIFNQGIRAIELCEKKRYSYDQAYLGTYRTSLPNHYNYGYELVKWTTYKYGTNSWDKSFTNISRKPFIIAPFYFGLKKSTGLSKSQLYHQSLDSISFLWRITADQIYTPAVSIATNYKSGFVSYKYPFQLQDSCILALRTSVDDTDWLVKIINGKEQKIYAIGHFYGSQIAFSQHYAAWEEIHYDPRWEQRNYSLIKILDLRNNSVSFLKKDRHFCPSINYSEKLIAVNNVDSRNNFWLEIYELSTKKLIDRSLHPEKQQLTFSSWMDNETIVLVCIGTKGKSIYSYNICSHEWKLLFGPTYNNITGIQGTAHKIYFTWQIQGKANIVEFDTLSGNLSQITNMLIGSEFPKITSDSCLLFSEYTASGYKLRTIGLNNIPFKPVSDSIEYKDKLLNSICDTIGFNMQDSVYQIKSYDSKPYRKLLNSLNIHSWLPFYVDYDNFDPSAGTTGFTKIIHPGFLLLSQNLLSNVISTFGYYYSDGHNYFIPSVYIRTFYPVVTFKFRAGGPPNIDYRRVKIETMPKNLDNGFDANISISLPLNMSSSRINLYLTTKTEFIYKNLYIADSTYYNKGNYVFSENNINYYQGKFSVDYNLNFYTSCKKAQNDIRPRWSFGFYASSFRPQLNKQYYETNNLASVSLTVPGFYRNHTVGILLQTEDGLGLRLALPRGYNKDNYLSIYNRKQVSVNYTLPLIYPDLSVGPILYLKRIHANLFYDYSFYKNYFWQNSQWEKNSGNLQSAGVELGFETNFLRFFMPVIPTIQYCYLASTQKNKVLFYFTTSYSFSL